MLKILILHLNFLKMWVFNLRILHFRTKISRQENFSTAQNLGTLCSLCLDASGRSGGGWMTYWWVVDREPGTERTTAVRRRILALTSCHYQGSRRQALWSHGQVLPAPLSPCNDRAPPVLHRIETRRRRQLLQLTPSDVDDDDCDDAVCDDVDCTHPHQQQQVRRHCRHWNSCRHRTAPSLNRHSRTPLPQRQCSYTDLCRCSHWNRHQVCRGQFHL